MSGTAVGNVKSFAVRRLKKSGLSGQALEIAIAAVMGSACSPKAFRIPREVVKRLGETLAQTGRAVVVSRGKHFKVYSLEGYEMSKANGRASAKANAPWVKAAQARRTASTNGAAA